MYHQCDHVRILIFSTCWATRNQLSPVSVLFLSLSPLQDWISKLFLCFKTVNECVLWYFFKRKVPNICFSPLCSVFPEDILVFIAAWHFNDFLLYLKNCELRNIKLSLEQFIFIHVILTHEPTRESKGCVKGYFKGFVHVVEFWVLLLSNSKSRVI